MMRLPFILIFYFLLHLIDSVAVTPSTVVNDPSNVKIYLHNLNVTLSGQYENYDKSGVAVICGGDYTEDEDVRSDCKFMQRLWDLTFGKPFSTTFEEDVNWPGGMTQLSFLFKAKNPETGLYEDINMQTNIKYVINETVRVNYDKNNLTVTAGFQIKCYPGYLLDGICRADRDLKKMAKLAIKDETRKTRLTMRDAVNMTGKEMFAVLREEGYNMSQYNNIQTTTPAANTAAPDDEGYETRATRNTIATGVIAAILLVALYVKVIHPKITYSIKNRNRNLENQQMEM